ncbi:MAG: hypothetical protein LUD81_01275 [Clostridiales bacterium]|nr:hypothetical protein [Clostridiales bacterium]
MKRETDTAKSADENKKNIHAGHRKRVMERYAEEGGLDSFADHQILELLLFYAYPRIDTNEIAHKFIEEFDGSIVSLFNASPEEIMNRCGVTMRTAVLISLVSDLSGYYIKKSREEPQYLDAPAKVQKYAVSRFVGKNSDIETFYIICLGEKNKKMALIKDLIISSNSPDTIELSMKDVVEKVLMSKAKFVVLTHNHPGGSLSPSSADVNTTTRIKDYLEPLGIKMLDHIIVSGEKYYSFAEHRLCGMKYKNK